MFSLRARDQVSHPYETTHKITALYVLFALSYRCLGVSKNYQNLVFVFVIRECNFDFLSSFPSV
jgi:hypothetical protein